MKITEMTYYPEDKYSTAEAGIELIMENGIPTYFHLYLSDGDNKQEAEEFAEKLSLWLSSEYENLLGHLVERFFQLKNDILPIGEEMTEEEFVDQLILAGLHAHKEGETWVYFESNDLFDNNMIVITLDEDFKILNAEIERFIR